jgi:hypothetical protein
MSWDSAYRYCVNRGMNLASFDSRDEADHFEDVSTTAVWVGIRDYDEAHRFIKVSDGKNVESLLRWGPNEPSRTLQRCVVKIVEANFEGFHDAECNRKFSFSCEFVETVDQ